MTPKPPGRRDFVRATGTALAGLALAPLAVRADEPPASHPEEETPVQPAAAEELPYGAGYEARQRAAQGEQQSRSREQAQAHERTRADAGAAAADARSARRDSDRAAAQRDARREARGQRPQRGPGGH